MTGDVAAYALMLGVPARRVGWMCQCGERLPAREGLVPCPNCGHRYRISHAACEPVEKP